MNLTESTAERDRPLVSFVLLTYNQEHDVQAALAGAFAQDYRPLQLIISDDGSTDQTKVHIREYLAHNERDDISVQFLLR